MIELVDTGSTRRHTLLCIGKYLVEVPRSSLFPKGEGYKVANGAPLLAVKRCDAPPRSLLGAVSVPDDVIGKIRRQIKQMCSHLEKD